MQGVAVAMSWVACVALIPAVVRAEAATCSKTSHKSETFDCSKTGCCNDKSKTCFLKDDGWGECLDSCEKGEHDDDPKEFRTAWSCAQVEHAGDKLLIKEYGQCGGMLAGRKHAKYEGSTDCEEGCHCFKQNKWISTCRPKVAGVACGAKHLRIGNNLVSSEFKINEKVEAKFAGLWYGAKIDSIHEDGTYQVAWATDNFLTSTTVNRHQLRHKKEKDDKKDEKDEKDEKEEKDKDDSDAGDGLMIKTISDGTSVAGSQVSFRSALMGQGVALFAAAILVSASVALGVKVVRFYKFSGSRGMTHLTHGENPESTAVISDVDTELVEA